MDIKLTPDNVEIIEATPDYRWGVRMERGAEQKVLQRAWLNRKKGEYVWQDVPEVRRGNGRPD